MSSNSTSTSLVTGYAGDYRLFRQLRVTQSPRPCGVERRDQVTYPAVEVHGMAAQAIVHQMLVMIVAVVQKNLFVSGGVWPRGPIRILLLMAFLAATAHPQHVVRLKAHLFGYLTPQMRNQAMNVLEVGP
jgi:hypothetical protein